MTSTFADVEKAILETIQENLQSVPKGAIVVRRSDNPPKKMPAIWLWSRSFTTSDVAVSRDGPTIGEVVRDEFNGDGEKVSFKLSSPPLRPLLSVEHPPDGLAREGEHFKIDYGAGMLTFFEPPSRGNKNLVVEYYGGKKAAEVKSLRVSLHYSLDVWATDHAEESIIIDEIVSVLVKTREYLESMGIEIRLRGGSDLTQKEGVPDGLSCRRLEFDAEANLILRMPIPRIQRIEVKTAQTARSAKASDGGRS